MSGASGEGGTGGESSEESLQWLRDHGVTVETPEDRVAIKKAAANLQTLKPTDPNTRYQPGRLVVSAV